MGQYYFLIVEIGVVYDNLINGIGYRIFGEGKRLRFLSKIRYIMHAVGLPLLFIPITDLLLLSTLENDDKKDDHYHLTYIAKKIFSTMVYLFVTYEFLWWINYDKNKLLLVDLRQSPNHRGNHLSGTLTYKSPDKFLELVLPAILLVLYEIFTGCYLIYISSNNIDPENQNTITGNTRIAGYMLLLSGIVTLLTSSIRGRPDIQLYGENFLVGLSWWACTLLLNT